MNNTWGDYMDTVKAAKAAYNGRTYPTWDAEQAGRTDFLNTCDRAWRKHKKANAYQCPRKPERLFS